nr:hypothetical protein [Tanacetum cinerariifolium]
MFWQSLCHHSVYIRDRPWCILGDFNSTLFLEDSTSSSSSFNISMREFKECVEEIKVMDVQRSGLQFTWSQKLKGKDGLLNKIDRIMANVDFIDVFVGAHAIFKPYRVLDHSPSVLNIPTKLLYEKGNLHTNVTRLCDDLDRAQIYWLREGDSNSAYFHKAVKSRISRSHIDVVTCVDGTMVDNEKVADALCLITSNSLGFLEVKDALFSMGNDKSPGPDGYAAAFFKESWEIIADDFFVAIRSPSRVTDYRPISCCNVLFKCISKIIANRIKESLKLLVSPNQSAFVLGKSIADNVLLTQELMLNYHLDRGPSQCAFKVDI